MKLNDFFEHPKLMRKAIGKILLIITFTVALIFLFFKLEAVGNFIQTGISMATPFFIGIAIAFIVNVLVKFYEQKVFSFLNKKDSKIWNKIRRGVCVALSYLTFLLILTAIIFFVIPELVSSLRRLTDNAPIYINNLSAEITKYLQKMNVTQEQINLIKIDWPSLITQATQITSNFLGSLFNATISVANGIFTMAMSFIFSVYMLFGKEKITRNLKRLIYAALPTKAAKKIIDIAILSNRIFSNFVRGQLIESCIWFFLCYIGVTIMRLPYSLLISSIVALCSLVPIIGPYISMFTAGFILLLVDPWYCVYYIVFFLLLQQFEGNVIYPRVVGTSVGLPGIWVLLAIILCGNMMGIAGILLGIPTFSVIYSLLRSFAKNRLAKKGITNEQILRNDPNYRANMPGETAQDTLPLETHADEKS